METKTKVAITFSFIIFLVAILYISTDWFSKVTGYFQGEGEIEKLVVCLNNNNAEFYTSVFCADCERQAKLFGDSFAKIRQVDCGREKENCPNIQNIPAWFIKDKIVYGLKTIEELKDAGECE